MNASASISISDFSHVRFTSLARGGHAAELDRRKPRLIKFTLVIAVHAAIIATAWNMVVESKPASVIRASLLAIDLPQERVVEATPRKLAQKASPQTKPVERALDVPQVETPAFVPAPEVPTVAVTAATGVVTTSSENAAPTASSSSVANPSQATPSPPAKPQIDLPSSSADYLTNPVPPYPPVSKRLKEQGRVLLRVFVSVDGNAMQVELRQSSGFERLDNVAIETVKRWKFVPGRRDGVAEAMWVTVPIVFELSS